MNLDEKAIRSYIFKQTITISQNLVWFVHRELSFFAEPFPDPFTFPILCQRFPSCRLQPWAASIYRVDTAWSRGTAFSTFERSTGHRSSSESNRNERGCDLRWWPWSPGITLLECRTRRPIFTAAFMTARPWKRCVCFLPVRFNGRRGYLLSANVSNYYFYKNHCNHWCDSCHYGNS